MIGWLALFISCAPTPDASRAATPEEGRADPAERRPGDAAFPTRAHLVKPERTLWSEGREQDLVIVKLAPNADLAAGALATDLAGSAPLFSRDPDAIRARRASVDPDGRLADLTRYQRVAAPRGEGPALADRLNARGDVELAYLAFAPQPPPGRPLAVGEPPPEDIDPATPDFSDQQRYLGAAPDGFGFGEAAAWPGGDGANVAVADLEYSWSGAHEDLGPVVNARTWGRQGSRYDYHGNSVWGQLVGGDNGYGVIGAVPAAEPVMIYPYNDAGMYSIADAVEGATGMLEPGDVLLIEQQAWANGGYCPVSIDPATFDAIALAVAAGVVVVEPGGNGSQDLDAVSWGGWFDRSLQDSGSIMVGGGASPDSGYPPRSWYPAGGSSYGERIDVQGWYDGIVTATSGDYGGVLADLYFPSNDPQQAYTQSFGGTSGASPLVAAAAAIFQSISIELKGEPIAPMELRALMVSAGTPQDTSRSERIGPQPDLRRMLRYEMVP